MQWAAYRAQFATVPTTPYCIPECEPKGELSFVILHGVPSLVFIIVWPSYLNKRFYF